MSEPSTARGQQDGGRDRRAVPTATYRLQVTADFPLDDAAAVADHLAALGVSHAYSSPLLRSAAGSTHGYDTVDHAHIDEARGGREGFDRFVTALHERGEDVVDDCFYLAFNAHHEPMEFTVPPSEYAEGWTVVVDTAELGDVEPVALKAGETLTVGARATVVLQAAA